MEREENCKQISLVCVGRARSVWATLGLPLVTACMLSQSTLLRLQVALQGNCLKRALGCTHFPSLNLSGSGSPVLHKGTDSVRPAFCALPRSEQVCHVSPLGSWSLAATLLADVNCPGSQEDLVRNCEPAHSLVEDAISGAEITPRLQLWLLLACFSASGGGMSWSTAS